MITSALVALFAAQAPAQHPPILEPAPGIESASEGPLDNDTDLALNTDAGAELALVEKTSRDARTGQYDARGQAQVLEACRRALAKSAPLDAVLDSASDSVSRRAQSIGAAVRASIEDAGAPEFRARFAGAAQAALDAAGSDDSALERVEHENPFTRAGALASLRRFDMAFERGSIAAARAALERADRAAHSTDADLAPAVARRRAALPARNTSLDAHDLDTTHTLRVERVVELDASAGESPPQRLRPSAAVGADGRVWIQSGEHLVVLEVEKKASLFPPAEIVGTLGAAWLPAFGDKDRPWLQRPAIEGARLALVLGRARAERGNALCVLDTGTREPRALWVHGDTGFAHANGDRAEPTATLLPGRLEFQPGPVMAEGLVIAQVLQWQQENQSQGDQHVDASRTSAWLVAFESESGRVAWKRRIATGADRRGRTASRFAEPRAVSCACLPLALQGDEVVAVTELGVAVRASALDGTLHETYVLKRARTDANARPGSGGPILIPGPGARCAFAPVDADGVASILRGPGEARRALRIDGLEELVGATDASLTALVGAQGRRFLQRTDVESGARVASVPFGRAAVWQGSFAAGQMVLCASGGRVSVFDARRELALAAEVDLDGLAAETSAGVLVRGSRAYVLGTRRVWVLGLD